MDGTPIDVLRRFAPAGLELPEALLAKVVAAYSDPARAYHDVRHLAEVLERFDEVAREVGWQRPDEVFLALLFHDVVYVPGAPDNEAQSAATARELLRGKLPPGALDRIDRLIMLTTAHGSLDPGQLDPDAALLLDCDLSILGAPAARFDEYERDVAKEFSFLPEQAYASGRRGFLKRLVSARSLFLSPHFRERLEGRARENLARALGRHPSIPAA